MNFERQYHFANISAKKAQISMKFETKAYSVVITCQINFHEHPCMNMNTICAFCMGVCTWMFMKFILVVHF